MKARKTLKNQGLIQEVISQISQRFAPKIPDIKKVGELFHFSMVVVDICDDRLSIHFLRRSILSEWKEPETRLLMLRDWSLPYIESSGQQI